LLPEELKTMRRGDLVEIELVNDVYKFDFEQAYRAVVVAHSRYPADMKAERLAVLIEMAFALGEEGLNEFIKMWRAIALEDWHKAADEILDSYWRKVQGAEVPAIAARVDRLALQMRVGETVL